MKVSSIAGIYFQHCSRDANEVAHQLVKKSYETKEKFIWDGDPLGFTVPFVINDVRLLPNK